MERREERGGPAGEDEVIRGPRIYLRAIETDDLNRCHSWINDEGVTGTLAINEPHSLLREASWVERVARSQDPSELALAICLSEGDRHIGNCGLHGIDMKSRTASLGLFIGEADCRGQGYGTEVVRTLCVYAFDELNLNKIRLDVYAFNEGAIRTYEKVGFRREGVLRQELYRGGAYHDVIRMGLLRGELR
jgi:RimJ/RimL family protein N-acetyltransferase